MHLLRKPTTGGIKVRRRNNSFVIRLDDNEFERLELNLSKTGMNRETYVRKLIMGIVPKELPSLDFISLIKQLRYIGNNINQIAMIANRDGNINSSRYERDMKELDSVVSDIVTAIYSEERFNGFGSK